MRPSSGSLAPAMALKFLRSGIDSANVHAMGSGQESWNFFSNDVMNHLPPPSETFESMLFAMRFRTATPHIGQVGISEWGRATEDGEVEPKLVFPYRLRFHPSGEIAFPDSFHGPINEDLVTVPRGTKLYDVFALDKPEEMGGTEKMIGEVVLTSNLITSKWGDKKLFFRHQDMAEDLRHHPEWREHTREFPSNKYAKLILSLVDYVWPPSCV